MKMKTIFASVAMMIASSILFVACKKDDDNTMPPAPTLYDSLGGTTMVTDPANSSAMIEKGRLGIRSVVDSTIFVIAADNRINGYFSTLLTEVSNNDLSGFMELSKNLTDFFAVAAGAKNYTYEGMSMMAAHDPAQNARMNGKAANDDFDAFVEDLVAGANKNNLPANLIASVGRLVETLRGQVVQQ